MKPQALICVYSIFIFLQVLYLPLRIFSLENISLSPLPSFQLGFLCVEHL